MAKSFDAMARRVTKPAVYAEGRRQGRELVRQLLLSEIREAQGVNQRDLARLLGVRQPSVSKLERQKDMQIATLRRFVRALGGELEIIAKMPSGNVRIMPLSEPKRRGRAA